MDYKFQILNRKLFPFLFSGDFAILLKTGLSVKYALTLNFISSLMALFGAIVGVSIAQQFDASFWIFAVTGGLFVYIALVDMVCRCLITLYFGLQLIFIALNYY